MCCMTCARNLGSRSSIRRISRSRRPSTSDCWNLHAEFRARLIGIVCSNTRVHVPTKRILFDRNLRYGTDTREWLIVYSDTHFLELRELFALKPLLHVSHRPALNSLSVHCSCVCTARRWLPFNRRYWN